MSRSVHNTSTEPQHVQPALLGTVAYRDGEKLEWDAGNLKVKNSEKAQHLLYKEYRKGWTL